MDVLWKFRNVECFGLAEDASSFALFQPPALIEIIDPSHVVSVQYYEATISQK